MESEGVESGVRMEWSMNKFWWQCVFRNDNGNGRDELSVRE